MRKLLAILTILTLTACTTSPEQMQQTIDESLSTYTKTAEDVFGESTEGGEITKYFDGQQLKKSEETYYGETGKSIIQLYYNKGEIFLEIKTKYTYNAPVTSEEFDESKTVSSEKVINH